MLGIGVFLSALADLSYLDAVAHGEYDAPAWAASLWPASALATAIAAWQPPVRVRPTQLEGRRLLVLPLIAMTAALLLLFIDHFDQVSHLGASLAFATLLVTGLRLWLTLGEHMTLLGTSRGEATTVPLTGLRNRRALLNDLDEQMLDASPQRPLLLLGALTRAALSERGDGFKISAALGAAVIDAPDGDLEEALRDADRRMYADKNGLRGSAGGQSAAVLPRVLTERDPDLGDHVDSVTALTEKVGVELGMSEEDRTTLWQAAALHDSAPALAAAARLVRSSHERFDGKGYPDQLAGDEIPLGARIVAVCDACDAMISDRPYRRAMPAEQAIEELRRSRGTQFDPAVVDAFIVAIARPTADDIRRFDAPVLTS